MSSDKDNDDDDDGNNKALMLLDDDDDDDDDDEIMKILIYPDEYAEITNQNEKIIIIKKLNHHFDKMIDKSKSFKDHIKSFKKVKILDKYYFINYFDDKVLKSKIFKLKLTNI